MVTQEGVVERAFSLARSGKFPTLADVIVQLKKENYHQVEMHLEGRTLRKQLRITIQNNAD